MCSCFGKHAHGWYVDYYGNNLMYGGQSVPVQPSNIDDFMENAILTLPHEHQTPNESVIIYNDEHTIKTVSLQ